MADDQSSDAFPGILRAWSLLPTPYKLGALVVALSWLTGWDPAEVRAVLTAEPVEVPAEPEPCPACPVCDTDAPEMGA